MFEIRLDMGLIAEKNTTACGEVHSLSTCRYTYCILTSVYKTAVYNNNRRNLILVYLDSFLA